MSTERPEESERTEESGPRRRRTPLAVASVAAAVLIAGGGGAYLAANASGDDGSGSGSASKDAPPPLSLDARTEGVAPGEPAPGGARYRAAGDLPDGPDSAPVYRTAAKVGSTPVKRLAEALGVPGSPRAEGNTWRVGNTKDGPSLQVGREAPGTWTYTLHGPRGTDNCPQGKVCTSASTPGIGTGNSDSSAGDDSKAVSEAAAKKEAAPVLAALGMEDARIDAARTLGAVRVVDADPVIGGLPVHGWSTGIQIGPNGTISGGNGKLGEPVKGAEYPVDGAAKTLERLNSTGSQQPRGGIGGCASAVPQDAKSGDTGAGSKAAADADTEGDGKSGTSTGVNAPCEPGVEPTASTAPPVEVTDAELGLAVQREKGRHVLVPSWLFSVRAEGAKGDTTVTHPAVQPRFLASSSAGRAEPTPAPSGTSPSQDGSGTGKRSVQPQSYEADGRTLTVTFWGGVCSEYGAKAEEKGDRVEVRITASEPEKGKVCIMVAKQQSVQVTLDKALGDRAVFGPKGTELPRS